MKAEIKIKAVAEYLRKIRLPAAEAEASGQILSAAMMLEATAKEMEGKPHDDSYQQEEKLQSRMGRRGTERKTANDANG